MMHINLDETTLNAVAKAKIASLEKENAKLQRKLTKSLSKIGYLEAATLSREQVGRIKSLAHELVAELECAKLVDIQQGL